MTNEKRDFDKDAATWDEKPPRVKLAEEIAQSIKEKVAVSPDMTMLDFGCGTGLITLLFESGVSSITGVDSSQGMLDVLNEKISQAEMTTINTEKIDPEQLDALSGSYDLVMCNMTLHHVEDVEVLLNQFYQVTAPEGYLCISDLDLDGGEFHDDNTGVYHHGFNREVLAQLISAAGYTRVQFHEAAKVARPEKGEFTVFLATGYKSEEL